MYNFTQTNNVHTIKFTDSAKQNPTNKKHTKKYIGTHSQTNTHYQTQTFSNTDTNILIDKHTQKALYT